MAVTAVDDFYDLTENTELHIGYEKTGYQSLIEVDSLDMGGAAQIEFAGQFGLLMLRSVDGRTIRAIDVNTRKVISTQFAQFSFEDMSLTVDERYLFAADVYGAKPNESLDPRGIVHRFDCLSRTWKTLGAPGGLYRIEAVSENRVLLQGGSWFADITLNTFDVEQRRMVELSGVSGHSRGDMEFDPSSGMIFQGGDNEVKVRRVVNDKIIQVQTTESSLSRFAGHNFGMGFQPSPTVLSLSTDGSSLFYRSVKIEADDIANYLIRYSENITAATANVAFGELGNFYDSRNGSLLGKISFPVEAIYVSRNDRDVWISESGTDRLHRFLLLSERTGVLGNDLIGQRKRAYAKLEKGPLHGVATVNSDGSFSYIPHRDFSGSDSFRYLLTDEDSATSLATVRLTVVPQEKRNQAPVAIDLEFRVDSGEQLRIEQATGAYHSGARQIAEFPSPGNVRQIQYSTSTGLLAVRNSATKVRIIDPATQRIVSEITANGNFNDMDLTPDGRYLMVADYDVPYPRYYGYVISSPQETFLHVYDMISNVWTTLESAVEVCHVEAVSFERVLTETCDGPVSVVLQSVPTSTGKLRELSRVLVHYSGDFEYDSLSRRVYHANFAHVFILQVSNDRLSLVEETYFDPNATGYDSQVVLSKDGKRLYSRQMEMNTSNTKLKLKTLRQYIYASSSELIFGENEIYDLAGRYVGKWDVDTDVQSISDDSRNWWMFDPTKDRLRHFALDGKRVGLLATATDAEGDSLILELLDKPANGSVSLLDKAGSVLYTPKSNFAGTDSFKYRVFDGQQYSTIRTVTIHVDDPSPIGNPPQTVEDRYVIEAGLQLNVGSDDLDGKKISKVREFTKLDATTYIAVSERYGIVATATPTTVQLSNLKSNALISRFSIKSEIVQMEMTSDERYLFVSEIGVFDPSLPLAYLFKNPTALIHRYDFVTREWISKKLNDTSYGNFAAISGNRIIQIDYVEPELAYLSDFTDDIETPLLELDRFLYFCYSEHIKYDWRTQRLYCGSQFLYGLTTLQVTGNTKNKVALIRIDEIADGNWAGDDVGSTLSPDGRYLYRRMFQADLSIVPPRLRRFPETILAGSNEVALGAKGFYDATNSTLIQPLFKPASVAVINSLGTNIWIGDDRTLQQWQIIHATGILENDNSADGDALRADLLSAPKHGTVLLRPNGSFTYTPRLGFSGIDTFTYVASSSVLVSRPTTVTIDVQGSWHNAFNGYDVDANGNVSPLDVLMIINALNRSNDMIGLIPAIVGYVDVDDSRDVSPLDVLLVINYLNSASQAGFTGSSEGRDQFFIEYQGEESLEEEMVLKKKLSRPFSRQFSNVKIPGH